MTSQTGTNHYGWLRPVIGGLAAGAIAASLVAGFGEWTAFADPGDQTTPTEAPVADGPPAACTGDDCNVAEPQATMTAEQALSIIATEYDTGAGGGQLSKLVHQVLALRAKGFKPSNANRLAIEEALDHRPNQAPLIEALQATLAYQRKLQAQAQMSGQGQAPVAIGAPTPGPTGPSAAAPGPAAGVIMPIG